MVLKFITLILNNTQNSYPKQFEARARLIIDTYEIPTRYIFQFDFIGRRKGKGVKTYANMPPPGLWKGLEASWLASRE